MTEPIVFVLLSVIALCLVGCSKEAAAIGIIGGADGPTAVFVTSNTNWLTICGLLGVIIVTILVGFMVHRTRNKK